MYLAIIFLIIIVVIICGGDDNDNNKGGKGSTSKHIDLEDIIVLNLLNKGKG